MKDANTKTLMLGIAESYENIATRALSGNTVHADRKCITNGCG
jgi:hypothetical protein